MNQRKRSNSHALEESKYLPSETEEHRRWRCRVIEDHFLTQGLIKSALADIQSTKKTAMKSIREARTVLGKYESFEERYNLACQKLLGRIISDEQESLKRGLISSEDLAYSPEEIEKVQIKSKLFSKTKDKIAKPTKPAKPTSYNAAG